MATEEMMIIKKKETKCGSFPINVVFYTENFALYHVKLALKINVP